MPPFKPALLIIDYQNDFCPPTGALAVPNARTLSPILNSLLALPWTLRIATQDWHPKSHISFASTHEPPNNKPFESHVTIINPRNADEKIQSRLWPDHCVQGTEGAELVSTLDVGKLDRVVRKGMDEGLEMYSAFAAPFREPVVGESELEGVLKSEGVTHVFVTGVATDYCVNFSAVDAARRGFVTYVIREAVMGITEDAEGVCKADWDREKVTVVSIDGEEVWRVKTLNAKK